MVLQQVEYIDIIHLIGEGGREGGREGGEFLVLNHELIHLNQVFLYTLLSLWLCSPRLS